jgi:hypothetical protein
MKDHHAEPGNEHAGKGDREDSGYPVSAVREEECLGRSRGGPPIILGAIKKYGDEVNLKIGATPRKLSTALLQR